jgi:hypothetical protein
VVALGASPADCAVAMDGAIATTAAANAANPILNMIVSPMLR